MTGESFVERLDGIHGIQARDEGLDEDLVLSWGWLGEVGREGVGAACFVKDDAFHICCIFWFW